jgi:hypothetical protein
MNKRNEGVFVTFRHLSFCRKRTSLVLACAVSIQINWPEESGPQFSTAALEGVRRRGDRQALVREGLNLH